MFIKRTAQKSGSVSIRVVESYRIGEKVRQRSLLYLGSGKTKEEREKLEREAERFIVQLKQERDPVFPGMEGLHLSKRKARGPDNNKKPVKAFGSPLLLNTCERERVIHGIGGVCGAVYDQMGFQDIIQGGYKDRQWNECLKALVLSRIAEPQSKRKTAKTLKKHYHQQIPLERIYRMMDHLVPNIHRVKKAVSNNTLSLFNQQVDILFFDVTTLYFESVISDDLKDFGFSKDGKFKEVQVVLALVTNIEGHPLSYELFPGSVAESKTLISCVENLKKFYSVNKAVLVADRGMFSERNLEFMDKLGFEYVVAGRLRALPKLKKEKILNSGLNSKEQEAEQKEREKESPSVLELEHKGRRLIVGWSHKRAKKNAKDRERLIDRLIKKVKKGRISIQSLIPNYGTKKYIQVTKGLKFSLNKEKIKEEARWDGFHGIVTNIKGERGKALLDRYKGLWRIEEAFRANKSSLRMRPIYHWTPRRIKAHIALCFLAYSLSYTLKTRLKSAGVKLSIEGLRDALKHDQYSIIEDKKTGRKYRCPSNWTKDIEEIYSAFSLKRISTITPLD